MTRSAREVWLLVIAATIVLALSQIADAQRGDGRRGPGGPGGRQFGGGFGSPALRLATIEKVQDALKLSDDQKSKIHELDEDFRDQRRKLLDDGGAEEGIQKLNDDIASRLAEVLDDSQSKRLRGIAIQAFGASAILFDPGLAKELDVSNEQKDKLREVQRSTMRGMWGAFRELRDLPGDERRAKMEKLRAEADKSMLDVLMPEQQEKLNTLKGEKVDFDMSELRGPRRGGFDGRGRGRGKGD